MLEIILFLDFSGVFAGIKKALQGNDEAAMRKPHKANGSKDNINVDQIPVTNVTNQYSFLYSPIVTST
jgi:hypothetical protein